MPDENLEEETYSLIFTSLKNPIRRKILRMLAKKHLVFSGMTFSEILESLSIDSGHLSYHLEKMGELLTRSNDGEYGLSSIGVAATKLMTGVEDYPKAQSKKWLKIRTSRLGIILITTVLIVALGVSWWYFNAPRYETLLSGRIKILRSDGETYRGWFFHEFDLSSKAEFFMRIEQELADDYSAGLMWYLSNSTKENFENTTYWYPSLVYTYGSTGSRIYEKTIFVNQTGTFTFTLLLPHWYSIDRVLVKLELSAKEY